MKTIQEITKQFIGDLTDIIKADARDQAMAFVGGKNHVKNGVKNGAKSFPASRPWMISH